MTLKFDLSNVRTTEFGVGRDSSGQRTFTQVVVDGEVQVALREMAQATSDALQVADVPAPYQPSEKHGAIEYLTLPLRDDLASTLRELHQANNLTVDMSAFDEPDKIFCYFSRFTDSRGRRLSAIRRAAQFKGIVKKRLVRLTTDALKMVKDNVFKLDNDFDLLMDSHNIHILRPSAFEFVGQLQEAILAAVPENLKSIASDIAFVDFSSIEEYAREHPRAARYLASIRAQAISGIDKRALKKLCSHTGVAVREQNGKLVIDDSQVLGFLEVLDRRRFEVELIKNSPEQYLAPSRKRLAGT